MTIIGPTVMEQSCHFRSFAGDHFPANASSKRLTSVFCLDIMACVFDGHGDFLASVIQIDFASAAS
jgi:hypothetical protein